jgi:uncharacterized protein YndB with AHSA1/START domain
MPVVEAAAEVRAPREALYALTQDYGLRLAWDPFLRGLRFLDGAAGPAPGVRVWVQARNGLSMEVEYVTVQPPERVAVKMVRGPVFFESFGGAWLFERLGEDRTRVVFRYGFRTRWPWLRPVLDRAVAVVFGRDVRARVAALKRAAEETDLLARAAGLIVVPLRSE